MLRQEKGITLVALIVTIIILIILAGVSIATLTGDHGALTEAQNAKILNSYNGASDQANLAFTTVRSKIMVESVKDSNYDARKAAAINGFMKTMKGDLPEKNGITFYVDKDNKETVDGVQVAAPIIYIKYSDASLKKGIIDAGVDGDNAKPAQPRQNGAVYATLTIREQSVSYAFNTEPPAGNPEFKHDVAEIVDPVAP